MKTNVHPGRRAAANRGHEPPEQLVSFEGLSTVILVRAGALRARLRELFADFDSLRVAAEASKEPELRDAIVDMKVKVAATGVLVFIDALVADEATS